MSGRFYKSGKGGFTLIEVLMAMGLGGLVIASLMSITLMTAKMHKAVRSQQRSLHTAWRAIEQMNTEIRMAEAPLRPINGNTVRFAQAGDRAANRWREIRLLPGADGDISTPWDNSLIYDPDIATNNDETIIAEALAPASGQTSAFYWTGLTSNSLEVHMRVADPYDDESIAQTGVAHQGAEIHVWISPRN